MGNQHRGPFVNAVDCSGELTTIERKADLVAGAKVVLHCGSFPIGQQVVFGSTMAKDSLGDAFEPVLGAARIFPDKHFGEVQQFVFHDAAEPFPHVMAGDAANGSLLPGGPRLSEQLRGDGNLKGALSGPGLETRGGTATGARHSLGNAKRERVFAHVDCLGDAGVEKMPVNRPVQNCQLWLAKPPEIRLPEVDAGTAQIAEHLLEATLAFFFRKISGGQQMGKASWHGAQIKTGLSEVMVVAETRLSRSPD